MKTLKEIKKEAIDRLKDTPTDDIYTLLVGRLSAIGCIVPEDIIPDLLNSSKDLKDFLRLVILNSIKNINSESFEFIKVGDILYFKIYPPKDTVNRIYEKTNPFTLLSNKNINLDDLMRKLEEDNLILNKIKDIFPYVLPEE